MKVETEIHSKATELEVTKRFIVECDDEMVLEKSDVEIMRELMVAFFSSFQSETK